MHRKFVARSASIHRPVLSASRFARNLSPSALINQLSRRYPKTTRRLGPIPRGAFSKAFPSLFGQNALDIYFRNLQGRNRRGPRTNREWERSDLGRKASGREDRFANAREERPGSDSESSYGTEIDDDDFPASSNRVRLHQQHISNPSTKSPDIDIIDLTETPSSTPTALASFSCLTPPCASKYQNIDPRTDISAEMVRKSSLEVQDPPFSLPVRTPGKRWLLTGTPPSAQAPGSQSEWAGA
jgi:hypothetical protein